MKRHRYRYSGKQETRAAVGLAFLTLPTFLPKRIYCPAHMPLHSLFGAPRAVSGSLVAFGLPYCPVYPGEPSLPNLLLFQIECGYATGRRRRVLVSPCVPSVARNSLSCPQPPWKFTGSLHLICRPRTALHGDAAHRGHLIASTLLEIHEEGVRLEMLIPTASHPFPPACCRGHPPEINQYMFL